LIRSDQDKYFKKYCQILLFLCINFVTCNLQASETLDGFGNDELLRQDPWGTYQLISQKNADEINSLTQSNKLLLLLRRAKTEHLLNYFTEFRATMLEIEPLIHPDTPEKIICHIMLYKGIAARINSQYILSEELLAKALKQAKILGLPDMIVFIKQEFAYTHAYNELYSISIKELQEAYVTAFKLDNDYLIALINETYGAIYSYTNDSDKAVSYYQKALSEYRRLGYPAHVGNALFGLASSFRFTKEFDKAIEYFERYIENSSKFTLDQAPSFYGLYGLAMALAEKGDCDIALTTINRALAVDGVDDFDAELYKAKAKCLISQQNLPQAEKALNQARNIFNNIPEVKQTKWYLETIKIESELELVKGNTRKAYELLNSYYTDYIEVVKSKASSKLTRTQAMLGDEQRNVEMSLLQQRNKVQSLLINSKNQQNKLLMYLTAFFVCFAVTVSIALLYRRKTSNELLTISITDPLTGLYNRLYIFESLNKIINGTEPQKQCLSVFVLDIDNLKNINEVYGHPFGDQVLKTSATLAQETLRIGDIMGRIGGEEFFGILPRTTKEQSVKICQRIVQAICQHDFVTSGGECVNINVNIGIAYATSETNTADILYSNADTSLYESKRLGKNKVTVYRGENN